MKRHYRIFLSSTYRDLVEERMNILAYIGGNQDIPFGMEYFPSDDRGAEQVIRSFLHQCDVFALIGHTELGSKRRPDGETWVEWELKLAISLGKKIIALLPDAPFEQRARISKILEGPDILFKEYAFKKGSTRPSLPEAFAQCYHQAHKSLEQDPICGLVSLTNLEEETHLIDEKIRQVWASPNLKRAASHLIEPRRILRRVRLNEHEREYAAKTLWRYGNFFGPKRRTNTVFFDGGASTIFTVHRLFLRLKQNRTYLNESRQPYLKILTNSPFCFELSCQLANELNVDIQDIRLIPQTGYNDDYGVYLGDLQSGEQPSAEELWESNQWNVFPENDFDIRDYDDVNEDTLVVSSISGFSPFSARCGERNGKDIHCGPWVRSFPNLQFKRSLVRSGLRTVFLMDSKKWLREAEERKSLFLFGGDDGTVTKNNVAYCIGTSNEGQFNKFKSFFPDDWRTPWHDDGELMSYDGRLFGVLAMPNGFTPTFVS
ncbi:MAG: DUF4062 domain-containing protein [Tateyamaria sp.]|uniref:DUF4062 domain-containing protein n=1 Tax=Tateyamaria sp. TaxID=1929288 RepID=UPI00329F5765